MTSSKGIALVIGLAPTSLLLSFPAPAQSGPNAPSVTVAKPIIKEVVKRDDFVGRFEAVDAVEIRSRFGSPALPGRRFEA